MAGYLARRVLQAIPVVFGITLLVFLMLRLIPGDPVRIMLGERATADEVERLRAELGLDRALPYQFADYTARLSRLDLGRSIQRNTPVAEELARAFPATFELTCAAMLIASLLGILLGVVAATHRNSWLDALCTGVSLGGVSVPIFWLGLILILIFPVGLDLFYFGGRTEYTFPAPTGLYLIDSLLTGDFRIFLDVLGHLVLPAITLSTVPLAMIARMTRSSLLEVLGQDYVRTARAKGLTPRQVLYRHALRNALLPIVTVMGLQFGYLLGGAVLTETVFSWPGVGVLMVDAVNARDYPLVQGCILIIALAFSLVNLLVDLAYSVLDPRVGYD